MNINWRSQLAQLIFSFYREDPRQLQQVMPLQSCKITRRWGTLRVDCREQQAAEALTNAIEVLREPIAQLRLAQQINIFVKGTLISALPVGSSKLKI